MTDALRSALEARLGAQYAIESLLGQGGMGSVYRATDLTLHRAVAIKVISGDVATNPQLKERFLLEARTVAKLRHPNIVAVYSAGEAEGLLYFVMELVPGESLRDLLSREGKVEPVRAERILHELALALDYAHQNGIVHRDVKPENILLDRETGRAMLTDFGVARALESGGNITGTGMILGSPRYMSPEQATGETTLDGRSDLYALALVGHEMFTGKPVVESGNVAGMLVKHLTETPKPIADVADRVPEGSAVAIDRALAKNRDERWASGREMAEVIGMAWTPTPGSGTQKTAAARALKGKSRIHQAAIIGPAVAIAASLLTVFIAGGKDKGDPRKSYAVIPFEIQSGNAEVQWLRDGAVNMLTLALSQWTDLTVVEYERTLTLVRDAGVESGRVDLERAQEIARRGGAGTVVMGLISTTSDSLVVVARLYDARSGDNINTATRATAIGADPRPLFDDLAQYLLNVAGGQSSSSVDVARATTTSLTAYRSYLDGVRLLNTWRLREADSAFQVAIRADSTFALAWHKRALALGWGDGAGLEYVASARRAVELADRLPARQQALVRGHLGLAEGLSGVLAGVEEGTQRLRESQQIYEQLLATDSLVAEGWYGLADAYFHDNRNNDSLPLTERRLTRSMRAFHRTLQVDSSFHLAYMHLVQQYQGLATPSGGAVLLGDSVVILRSPQHVATLGGPQRVAALRADAERRGLEMARGWVRTDTDAPAAHLSLANGLVTAGLPDSAIAVVERAQQRPSLQTSGVRLQSLTYYLLADDPKAFDRMRAVTNEPVAALRQAASNERVTGFAMALATAAGVGNAGEVDRLVELMSTVDPTFPFTRQPTKQMMSWYATGLKGAITGTLTPPQRQMLLAGAQRMTQQGPGMAQQIAATAGSVIYAAYYITRDTAFSAAYRALLGGNQPTTDFDALAALAVGDTARARTIAATFTPPESLSTARFSHAGMRAVARAEVLAAVGNTDWALRYLEALDPARFAVQGLGEPGFAIYTRSFASRARLYEERGERAKAIAAYEEFLRRTANGDAAIEPERRAVRAALQRLRDGGR